MNFYYQVREKLFHESQSSLCERIKNEFRKCHTCLLGAAGYCLPKALGNWVPSWSPVPLQTRGTTSKPKDSLLLIQQLTNQLLHVTSLDIEMAFDHLNKIFLPTEENATLQFKIFSSNNNIIIDKYMSSKSCDYIVYCIEVKWNFAKNFTRNKFNK